MAIQAAQLVATVTANTGQAQAALANIGRQFEQTGRQSMTGMAKLGGAVIAVGIGLAAFSIHEASQFQAAMTRVQTQAGASAAEVKRMGAAVLELAGPVAQSPIHLADALFHIESVGFRGATALDMLKQSAIGATIGHADLESVTNAMVGSMVVGFKDVRGAADTMAYLNTIVGIGNMRMEKLAASIGTGVLPAFKSAGLGMIDFGASLATLTDNAVPADEAATRLRMTVSLMAAPSGKAIKALKEIGLSSTALANDMHQPRGLLVAVRDLKTHLEHAGLTAVQQNQVIQHAFGGGRTSGAILTLLGEYDRLASKYVALGTAAQRSKTYHDAWIATQKTFAVEMAKVGASISSIAIGIGQKLIPIVEAMGRAFVATTAFLQKHHDIALAVGLVVGGILVMAVGLFTVALYGMATAAIAAAGAITILGAPLWIIVAIIAAVIFAVVMVIRHWKDIEAAAESLWHVITKAWGAIEDATSSAWDAIVGFTSQAWDAISKAIMAPIVIVAGWLATAWHAMSSTVTTVFDAIAGFFKKWWPLLLIVFAAPVAILLAAWNHFHKQITDTVHTVWNAILDTFKFIWGAIKGLAAAEWAGIQAAIIKPVVATWHIVVDVFNTVKSAVVAVWHAISAAASAVWDSIKNNIVRPAQQAYDLVAGIFGRMKNALSSIFHAVLGALSGIAGEFISVGKAIVDGIVNGITGAASSVVSAVTGLAKGALNAAKSFLGVKSPSTVFRDEVGVHIATGLAAGIDTGTRDAVDATERMAKAVTAKAMSLTKPLSLGRFDVGAQSQLANALPTIGAAAQQQQAQFLGGGLTTVTNVHIDGKSIGEAVEHGTMVVLSKVVTSAASGRR